MLGSHSDGSLAITLPAWSHSLAHCSPWRQKTPGEVSWIVGDLAVPSCSGVSLGVENGELPEELSFIQEWD